jgi:hypothetical protein
MRIYKEGLNEKDKFKYGKNKRKIWKKVFKIKFSSLWLSIPRFSILQATLEL